MATSPLFGWEEPDDVDLVKDGAAAIRTLGNAIDTSMGDLLGGTSGQVLSKNSNTNMDFTWVTPDDANAIQNAIVDAKGDLIAASAADTPARLAVGNNGETLVADSSATTGLRYQANFAAGKNLIINGAMDIDQRANGASTTPLNFSYASCDRYQYLQSVASKYTSQRNAASVTPPTGFNYYLGITSSSSYSVGSSEVFGIVQSIEDLNSYQLAWGTASAQTVTLSFWVRSSLTGTFGGSIFNVSGSRSYVFSYSIPTANTWTKISTTIPGDTGGSASWFTSGYGPAVCFSLGTGSSQLRSTGWSGTFGRSVTGETQIVGTSGATWYMTGLQLELGNVGTAFARAAGTIQGELAACQRYYYVAASGANTSICNAAAYSTNNAYGVLPFKVSMRTAPTLVQTTGTDFYTLVGGNTSDGFNSFASITNATTESCRLDVTSGITSTQLGAYWFIAASASASLAFSAEL